jgi:peptidoglycan hydrolase-like protein with peptidoglycan-binding domain
MANEPERVLGDSDEWVAYLQQLLEHNGFQVTADGHFGPDTEEALKAFQQRAGLPDTGRADDQTWLHLTGEAGPHYY